MSYTAAWAVTRMAWGLSAHDVVAGHAVASEYRSMMSRFPTGVAVVTSVDRDGTPRGMTCSSLTSICVKPPTLMVCLRTESATFAAIRESNTFAVNILSEQSQETAELFASRTGDRFVSVSWRHSAGGLPWLTACAIASADCTVAQVIEVGDHAAAFGEVRNTSLGEGSPLLYGLRSYARWRLQDHRRTAT